MGTTPDKLESPGFPGLSEQNMYCVTLEGNYSAVVETSGGVEDAEVQRVVNT